MPTGSPRMSFEWFISSRYLRSKQKQAFISLITTLSVAGVTVGVMALIIVIAVMTGATTDLKNRILGVASHIVVGRYGAPIEDYGQLVKTLDTIPGVSAATPFIHAQTMLRSSDSTSGAVLRGIAPETAGKVIQVLKNAGLSELARRRNHPNDATSVPGIILGRELAGSLNVTPGSTLYVISPKGMLSPIGHVPSMRRFKVIGIFNSGMYEYDSAFAFIDLQDAQHMMHLKDSVTGVEVQLKDPYQAPQIAEQIKQKLGFSYWTRDWIQMNHNLFSALKLEKTVMFIILTLIILVAAFNIAGSLIMTVMEKTKDIAILKAMGATNRSIGRIFVFKGMVIGCVGTALGIGLGSLLCTLLAHYQFVELPPGVYYFDRLPVQLELLDVCAIAVSTIVICFLATLYPARQAARYNPVEAIRYG